MPANSDTNRRDFLKQTATAAGAGLLAGSTRPKRLRAEAGSANERIGIGVIGLGGMGNHHLDVLRAFEQQKWIDLVAVCDVFDDRLDAAAGKTKAKPYKVWTDLLADKGVDAVLLAVPDHWHAPMTIAAAEAGKDIYCEKPMVHWQHFDLAKKVVDTIARTECVMQVGTQLYSHDIWNEIRKKVPALGRLIQFQSTEAKNGPQGAYISMTKSGAVPGKNLDWDMWQGCETTGVEKHAFEKRRFYAFRAYWDYSGGVITDMFPHELTPWVDVLELGFPKRVVTTGGLYHWKDGREVPDTVNLCADYDGGPNVNLQAFMTSAHELPTLVRGQKAALVMTDLDEPVKIIPEGLMAGDAEELKVEQGVALLKHWRNFLECVKTRKKPISNEVLGLQVMAPLCMGVMSYRSGKAMGFDPTGKTIQPC